MQARIFLERILSYWWPSVHDAACAMPFDSCKPPIRALVTSGLCLLLVGQSLLAAETLTFEKHVRPILKQQCFHCHGEAGETSGDLDVRLVRLMAAGGESGAAIVPGEPEASLLWRRIESDEMPDGEKKLTPEQKHVIKQWITQGAKTSRPEPDDVEQAKFTPEELSHWSYQPVQRPPIPKVSGPELNSPIDAFLARKILEHDLKFSPVADRPTLIRRVTFNLTGLPPSPEEVDRFVSDPSPRAYANLIERLLSSPQFGVRWGRHWLDVVGYAESDGGENSDTKRPHAWRYRDYVVDAFNQSKPVDRFFVEQLAGDELIAGAVDPKNKQHRELLTATGFIRMAPDSTQTANNLEQRNMAAAAATRVVGSSLLGITVGCAQCHDHKYDPIGIDDYYRFRSVFDPVFPLTKWPQPSARLIDFTPEDIKKQRDEIEAQAVAMNDDLVKRRNELAKNIQNDRLALVSEDERDATRTAVLTDAGKQTPEQKKLLEKYPMVRPINHIIGLLVEYDSASYRKFEKELEQIAALRTTKPPAHLVRATRETEGAGTGKPCIIPGRPTVAS